MSSCERTSDDLSSSSLAILGAFNNSWQVENLNRRAMDVHCSWYTDVTCERVGASGGNEGTEWKTTLT